MMTEQTVFLLGIFTHFDTFLAALHRLKERGYEHITVFSPVPRHELEEVLEHGRSPVRYFTLGGGFLGALTGSNLGTTRARPLAGLALVLHVEKPRAKHHQRLRLILVL